MAEYIHHPSRQGSTLQIQGPRGFKGSKGDAVRLTRSCTCMCNVHSSKVASDEDAVDSICRLVSIQCNSASHHPGQQKHTIYSRRRKNVS